MTVVPLSKTKIGEPELRYRMEWLNTDPRSDPGWFRVQLVGFEVASETVHELVPQESPEGALLPLTKLTASRKVTTPVPLDGAVQSTVHVLELELE